MLENLKKYHVILASNSPRRKELLGGLGIPFEVKTLSGIAESFPQDLHGAAIAEYISSEKADGYKALVTANELVITADTIVFVEHEDGRGEVLGKPKDAADAKAMLRKLSGKSHLVITGVTIQTKEFRKTFSTTTKVTFAALSDAEIDYYVERFAPLDKAGAYGIQEWIGYIGVTGIEGSFYNVMGLPIQRLYAELKHL